MYWLDAVKWLDTQSLGVTELDDNACRRASAPAFSQDDMLPRVQTRYLRPQMEAARTRLAAARTHEASLKEIADLEDELSDLEDCNGRLEQVIQGTVKVDLPEWAVGPYRDGRPPYDPDLDDGVKVNLLPIQEAGLLPVKKVV